MNLDHNINNKIQNHGFDMPIIQQNLSLWKKKDFPVLPKGTTEIYYFSEMTKHLQNFIENQIPEETVRQSFYNSRLHPQISFYRKGIFIALKTFEKKSEKIKNIVLWIEKNKIIIQGFDLSEYFETKHKKAISFENILGLILKEVGILFENEVEKIDDDLEDIEMNLQYANGEDTSMIRRKTVNLFRHIIPQIDMINILLNKKDIVLPLKKKQDIQDTLYKFMRIKNLLENIRERAIVVQDSILNRYTEKNMYHNLFLSAVATIFLPLGFITGLFGMNVKGIPFATYPQAYTFITITCLIIMIFSFLFFRWKKWF